MRALRQSVGKCVGCFLLGLCVMLSCLIYGYAEAADSQKDAQPSRSVRLNSYGVFQSLARDDPGYREQGRLLARRDWVALTETYARHTGLRPAHLRKLNPGIKVLRLYDLCCKNPWDSDSKNADDASILQTPITMAEIEANDWWLRDGAGNKIEEDESGRMLRVYMLDVGKPGFKEAFLRNTLERLEGQGFDGILFDYLFPQMIDRWVSQYGRPMSKDYPTNERWLEKAWKPFLRYVVTGLHDEGYVVIGNCAGEHGVERSDLVFQRSLFDGTVYESWAFGFKGEWLQCATIERRIRAFSLDPLDVAIGESGVRIPCPEYREKAEVSLAMYYIALPGSADLQAKRSYNYYADSTAFWDDLWNQDIGVPEFPPVHIHQNGKARYAWVRRFTKGVVLLNYEPTDEVSYTLTRRYRDSDGRRVSGTVTMSPRSAMILTTEESDWQARNGAI